MDKNIIYFIHMYSITKPHSLFYVLQKCVQFDLELAGDLVIIFHSCSQAAAECSAPAPATTWTPASTS